MLSGIGTAVLVYYMIIFSPFRNPAIHGKGLFAIKLIARIIKMSICAVFLLEIMKKSWYTDKVKFH